MCGHHSRTWNREWAIIPSTPEATPYPWIDNSKTEIKRLYYRLCIIKYLLFTVSPHNTFTNKLKSLTVKYPTVGIEAMGFPL